MTLLSPGVGAPLWIAAAFGAAAPAAAQISPAAVAECAAITVDHERLACYDRAARRPQAPPAATPAAQVAQPTAATLSAERSLIDKAWGFAPDSEPSTIALYNPNYLLLARYTDRVNTAPFRPLFQAAGLDENLDNAEAKFQVSFKLRLWTTDDRRWGVWTAYTQQNQWQVYNGDTSKPFRETNYMPEIFVSYRPGIEFGGFHWRLLNFGYTHQSNGRSDILSRSWDRLFAEAGVERGNFALLGRVWYRIKESANKDDNPDITDFYGYGSLTAIYKWGDHSFSLMGRGNMGKGKGAAELTWTSPRIFGPLRAYVQGFTGYGESLIDYNWNQSTIGVGIALNDAL